MPCIALAEGVVKKASKKKKHEMAEGQNVEQQTAVEVEQVVEQKNEEIEKVSEETNLSKQEKILTEIRDLLQKNIEHGNNNPS